MFRCINERMNSVALATDWTPIQDPKAAVPAKPMKAAKAKKPAGAKKAKKKDEPCPEDEKEFLHEDTSGRPYGQAANPVHAPY